MKRFHPWHLVSISPWPFYVSFAILFVVLGFVRYLHFFSSGLLTFCIAIVFVFCFLLFWWRDVIRESILGYHSPQVKFSLRFGFVLFIASEVMFFFGIFWTLFYYKLSPEIQIGIVWPPEAIFTLNPLDVPLLNTLILVTSGVSITVVHHDIVKSSIPYYIVDLLQRKHKRGYTKVEIFEKMKPVRRFMLPFAIKNIVVGANIFMKGVRKNGSLNALNWFRYERLDNQIRYFFTRFYFFDIYFFFSMTLILAFAFTGLQLQEYWEASFQIKTSIYGSIFYFSTGFHGLHVLLGSIFLFVCFVRFLRYQMKSYPFPFSDGFWMAIWYWHFVDVVWLGLYFFLYLWGEKLDWSSLIENFALW